jgi:hypothetical protein
MRVVNVRTGLSKFYGAVHSFASLPHRGGRTAAFSTITTPAALKSVDAKHLDRVVVVDKRLLGPVPYRGGDVELEVGLFSIKQADLAGPFLSVLESMSDIAGVSFVKAALPFAKPLTEGIQLLTGSDGDSILEVGLAANMKAPMTGYYVVIRGPKGKVDVSKLRLTARDNMLVDAATGQPLGEYPYIVLEVSASDRREAWFEIDDLKVAHQELDTTVRAGKVEDAKAALAVFRRTALTSDDLVFRDAERIVGDVTREVNIILGNTPTAAGAGRGLTPLHELRIYD